MQKDYVPSLYMKGRLCCALECPVKLIFTFNWFISPFVIHLLYPRPTKLVGGILDLPCPSVCLSLCLSLCLSPCLSVCSSICRRHYFRSLTRVCLGISISNFICMLFVAMARHLLIFSDVAFKMAARRPYWIFRFPDSNFSLALNIKSKPHWHITCVYGKKPKDFQLCHFQNGPWQPYWIFRYLDSVFGMVSGA